MLLKNKVAVVTGGGRGIGKAIAHELAREGAKVVIASRSEKELREAVKEIQKISKHIAYCVTDVAKDTNIKHLMKKTIDTFNAIDILVTAAGIYGPMGDTESIDLKKWNETININLLGLVRCAHEAIPYMKNKGGVIIALAGAGVPTSQPYISAYSTSKAAVVQFITNLAAEYKNIRCNTIAPGAVATKLTEEVIKAGPKKVGKEFYEKNLAWKRGEGGAVSPYVVAKYIVKLCADDCNVTGKYLSAVWDKDLSELSDDIYTLRRIDGVKYKKKK